MLFSKAIISSLYKLMLFMFFLLVLGFVLNVILVFISKLGFGSCTLRTYFYHWIAVHLDARLSEPANK